MNFLTDSSLIIAFLNVVTMFGNIFYYNRISKSKSTTEVITSLNAALDAKDKLLQDKDKDLDNMTRQYDSLLLEKQKLEAEVKTYHRFHGHTPQL